MGCLLDFTSNQISYTLNGSSMGMAFEVPAQMHGQPLYPAVALKGGQITSCFGGTRAKFRYGPPAGFTGIADAPSSHLTTGMPSGMSHSLSPTDRPVQFRAGSSPICHFSLRDICHKRQSFWSP